MQEKILIVDDDLDFRQEMKDFFDTYDIVEANSGEECLKILRRANEIGLVVLDVKMPGLSGTEVLKEIKNIDPNLGIIILTGYSSKDVAVEALKGHADDYMEKPLNLEDFKDSVERILGKRKGEPDIIADGIDGKIEKVKRFTERNKFKKTTLKDVTSIVYLSPKYLSRVFKQVTGESFSNYRLKIKINASKELLKKTKYNINQISDKLGYENTESFIRQFKNRTGFTPTEYRTKPQKKKLSKNKR